ncbi:NAD(P)H-binding protein [Kitasatospora sp. NPDC057692]|uniref:NAD(P)H-binding protein n=1 Tax=Kitasatospora sp. NPDC057692 TaxID=3346215 RepID=UPI0036B5F90F
MIVVTGASGALGRLVLDRLLALGPAGRVAAAVRRPAALDGHAARGVDVRRADYGEPASLREAFAGAERVLLISSPELAAERRTAHHRAVAEAARAAGVRRLVYTSFLGADTAADGLTEAHHATELLLRESGLATTVLRNPFYTEGFVTAELLRTALATGTLAATTGGRVLNTATRADLAQAAARVLVEDGHEGAAYDLTGAGWTHPELAALLPGVAHREADPAEEPPGVRRFLNSLARSGALERRTADLALLLGRPATPLADTVHALLAAPEES